MDLLMVVTTPDSGPILAPMVRACTRAGITWEIFFTHDGVKTVRDDEVGAAIADGGRAVVCQDSWKLYLPGVECPVELGSQTSNSAMLSNAKQVVSL